MSKRKGSRPALDLPSTEHVLKPASFYHEDGDLAEPHLEEVEREIEHEIEEAQKKGKSRHTELTLDLVLQHHALDEQLGETFNPDDRAHFFQHLTHLRLDRMHLGGGLPAPHLAALPRLTHVYLQHNQLTSMAGLASLPALRFAALSHNRIEEVQGLSGLASLMFIDLSHNRLKELVVQGLPCSISFLKVASNPCTEAGTARLKADLLAHLPRLRDLDGPLSSSDDDSDEREEEEEEGGVDDQEKEGGAFFKGMLKHEQQGLAGSKGDGADDSGPLPPLSQVSNEGLPGRRKSRGRHDEGKQASGGEGATARGNAGAEKDLLLSHLGGEGGGNGRLVTSALNMLEELERACYASSNRASCASLRSSMSRAMRSVADHLGMRQSRHKILGAEGLCEGRADQDPYYNKSITDPRLLSSNRPGSNSSNRGVEDGAGSGSSGTTDSRIPSNTNGTSSDSAAKLQGGASGQEELQQQQQQQQQQPLFKQQPALVPMGDRAVGELSMPGQLRPVTPPARSLSVGSRNPSARFGAPGIDRPLSAASSLQHAGHRIPSPPHPQHNTSPAHADPLQRFVDADLEMLRDQLQALTEPMAAAAAQRPPACKPTAATIVAAAVETSHEFAARSGAAGATTAAASAAVEASHRSSKASSCNGAAKEAPKAVGGKGAGGVGARGGSAARPGGRGLSGGGARGNGAGVSAGRGGGSAAERRGGLANGTVGVAGRGGRGVGAAGRGEGAEKLGMPAGQRATVASSSKGAKAAGGGGAREAAAASMHTQQGMKTAVGAGTEAAEVQSFPDAVVGGGTSEAAPAAVLSGGEHAQRPGSAARAARTLLWSSSARPPPSSANPGALSTGGSRPSSSASMRLTSASLHRPASLSVHTGSAHGRSRPVSANVRPSSAHAGVVSRPGSGGSTGQAVGGSSRPSSSVKPGNLQGPIMSGVASALAAGGSTATSEAANRAGTTSGQPNTWLQEELAHKMSAAAARVQEQRARQEALSAAIRAMRGGNGDGNAQESMLAELRSGLSLRAAVEAGPGAADAVRSTLMTSSQDPLRGEHRRRSILSALRQHATSMSDSGHSSVRAAAVADQDRSLRTSMARLERLTSSTKAALAARLREDGGDQGMEDVGDSSAESESDEGEVLADVHDNKGASVQQSKYLEIIRARAEARQQQQSSTPESREEGG